MIDEQIDLVSRAFLGLSVSCARCHDHKFDPIPTRDYYASPGSSTAPNRCMASAISARRRRGTRPGDGRPRRGTPGPRRPGVSAVADREAARSFRSRAAIATASSAACRISRRACRARRRTRIDRAGSPRQSTKSRIGTSRQADRRRTEATDRPSAAATAVDDGGPGGEDAERLSDPYSRRDDQPRRDGPRGMLQLIFASTCCRSGPAKRPAAARRVVGQQQPAHAAGGGQSRLAALVRPRDRRDGRRLRHGRQSPVASGVARPSRRAVRARRLVRQAFDSHDGAQPHLSARLGSIRGTLVSGRSPRQRPALATQCAATGSRSRSAMRCSPSAGLDRSPPAEPFLAQWNPYEHDRIKTSQPFVTPEMIESPHRSVYLPVLRESLPELFTTVRLRRSQRVVGKRDESTLPSQSLFLMNSHWMMERSRHGGKRLLADDRRMTATASLCCMTVPMEDCRPRRKRGRALAYVHQSPGSATGSSTGSCREPLDDVFVSSIFRSGEFWMVSRKINTRRDLQ